MLHWSHCYPACILCCAHQNSKQSKLSHYLSLGIVLLHCSGGTLCIRVMLSICKCSSAEQLSCALCAEHRKDTGNQGRWSSLCHRVTLLEYTSRMHTWQNSVHRIQRSRAPSASSTSDPPHTTGESTQPWRKSLLGICSVRTLNQQEQTWLSCWLKS